MELPSIIRETEFNEDGLVVTEQGLLVPAYMASQWGFTNGRFTPGEQLLRFYDELNHKANVLPLCPFAACGEYLDLDKISQLERHEDVLQSWRDFRDTIGEVNYEMLMPRSKLLVAILDGGHAVDDGVACETGYYHAKFGNPIVGIRNDLRLAESPACGINAAIYHFLKEGKNGILVEGPSAYERAIDEVAKITAGILGKE